MGMCGCGDNLGVAKIKNGEGWLVIEIYPGCEDCCQVLDVSLKVPSKEDYDCFYSHLPDLTEKLSTDNGVRLPVLSLCNLIEQVKLSNIPIAEYDCPGDFISDCFHEIRLASIKTRDDWEESGQLKT